MQVLYENRNLKLFTSLNKQALQFKICVKQPNGKQKQFKAKLQSQKQLQQKYLELKTYQELKKFIKQSEVVSVDLEQNIMIIKDKNKDKDKEINNSLNTIEIQLDGKKQLATSTCMDLILQKCGKKQNMKSDDIKQIFQSIAQTLQILQTNTTNYQKISTRQQIKIRDNIKFLHRNNKNKPNPETWVSQKSFKIVQDKLQKDIKQIKDKYMKNLADNQLKIDVKLSQCNQELTDIKTKITNLENKQANFKQIFKDYVPVKNYQLDLTNFSERIKSLQEHLQPKQKKSTPVDLKQWIDQPNNEELTLKDNRIVTKKQCQIYSKKIIKKQYRYCVKVIKKQYFISLGIIDKKQIKNQTPQGSVCNEIIFNNYGECFLFGQIHNQKSLQQIKDGDQVTIYINRTLGFIQWSINGSIIYTIKHEIILDSTNIDWVGCITLDSKNDTIEISQII